MSKGFSQHFFSLPRLEEDDTDDELCWMDKPLEETTIKIPAKPSLIADIESDLMLPDAEIGPANVVEPASGMDADSEVVIGAAGKVAEEVTEAAVEVTKEVTEAAVEVTDATAPEADDEPFIGPMLELKTEPAVPTATPKVTEIEEQTTQQPIRADAECAHANSLAHLLPANTFAQISPRSYLFPGAEVTVNNMDGAEDSDTDGEYSDDEEEEENESASANASEIIVPDIDNVLSNEVSEKSPAPTVGTLSPTPSTSQLQSNDPETAENITEIQADDANEDLQPAPMKRPRLNADAEAIF